MRSFYRYCWLPFYRFWALRHIRKTRNFRYAGLRLSIPQGVFHPGVFFSTPVFASFLQKVDFQSKTVLDVGTGSGLLALLAARRGASVTAFDINPLAVKAARQNAEANGLSLCVWESDLFDHVPAQTFDYILANPPYYPRQPRNATEYAFFAGENFGYFEKLFRQAPDFIHADSKVWMILSEDCDMEKIAGIAIRYGFNLSVVDSRKKWGERFLVMSLMRVHGK